MPSRVLLSRVLPTVVVGSLLTACVGEPRRFVFEPTANGAAPAYRLVVETAGMRYSFLRPAGEPENPGPPAKRGDVRRSPRRFRVLPREGVDGGPACVQPHQRGRSARSCRVSSGSAQHLAEHPAGRAERRAHRSPTRAHRGTRLRIGRPGRVGRCVPDRRASSRERRRPRPVRVHVHDLSATSFRSSVDKPAAGATCRRRLRQRLPCRVADRDADGPRH